MIKTYEPEQRIETGDFLCRIQNSMIDNEELKTEHFGRRCDDYNYFSNGTACVISIYNNRVLIVGADNEGIRRTIGNLEMKSGIKLREKK